MNIQCAPFNGKYSATECIGNRLEIKQTVKEATCMGASHLKHRKHHAEEENLANFQAEAFLLFDKAQELMENAKKSFSNRRGSQKIYDGKLHRSG